MKFNFEKFVGQNVRSEKRITVTKSYSFGFPQKFYNENKIKDYKYVSLFWDKENMAVGLHFTNDEDEKNKFSIIHSQKGYGGSLVARSFFKSYNINPKKYHGRYQWKKIKLENVGTIFVIELKQYPEK